MQVLAAILLLVVLSLLGFRLYTHLAVHERRVVAAWDRLDTLLTQRNGLLQRACATTTDPPDRLHAVHLGVQEQERARRCGDLSCLANSERMIRASWHDFIQETLDNSAHYTDRSGPIPRRVAALDQAITEALGRYNAAVVAYDALWHHWAFGPLARIAGYTAFQPVGPPRAEGS